MDHDEINRSKTSSQDSIGQNQISSLGIAGPQSSALSIVQRVAMDPYSLNPMDVMQLQKTLGNEAVGWLLETAVAQPIRAKGREVPVQNVADFPQVKEAAPIQKWENHSGMTDGLKTGLESWAGMDISEVRERYNAVEPEEIEALAYTQGTDIHVASGQQEHLPHEEWRAVQQSQGSTIQCSRERESAEEEMKRALHDYDEDLEDHEDKLEEYDGEDEDEDEVKGQETKTSCGIAAVQMALETMGLAVLPESLIKISQQFPGSYKAASGMDMDNMAAIIKYLKKTCEGPKTLSLTQLQSALKEGNVIIARVVGNNGHFVVIDKIEGDEPVRNSLGTISKAGTRQIYIRDPWPPGAGSSFVITEDEFQSGRSSLSTTALYLVCKKA